MVNRVEIEGVSNDNRRENERKALYLISVNNSSSSFTCWLSIPRPILTARLTRRPSDLSLPPSFRNSSAYPIQLFPKSNTLKSKLQHLLLYIIACAPLLKPRPRCSVVSLHYREFEFVKVIFKASNELGVDILL